MDVWVECLRRDAEALFYVLLGQGGTLRTLPRYLRCWQSYHADCCGTVLIGIVFVLEQGPATHTKTSKGPFVDRDQPVSSNKRCQGSQRGTTAAVETAKELPRHQELPIEEAIPARPTVAEATCNMKL